MRLASIALCAALIGGASLTSTAASAQGWGYGPPRGYDGYGYRRDYGGREARNRRAAERAAAYGDYGAARHYYNRYKVYKRLNRYGY